MDNMPTFSKRPGCTDKGKEYETLNTANIVLNLLTDEEVKDFYVSSNDVEFGAFDDITVELKTPSYNQLICIQLKHRQNKGHLTVKKFNQNKGDFNLSKYFKSFQEFAVNDQKPKCILFTNCDFYDQTEFPLDDEGIFIKAVKENGVDFISKISDNADSCYKFEIAKHSITSNTNSSRVQEYQTFFENFYFLSSQRSCDVLKKTIPKKFKEKFASEEIDKFLKVISNWDSKDGTKEKLSKKWIQQAIAIHVLSNYIKPLTFGMVNEKIENRTLREAIALFNITVFEENSCDKVGKLLGDFKTILPNTSISTIHKINHKFQLTANLQDDIDQIDSLLLSKLLWLMDKCPLIVSQNESIQHVIKLCDVGKIVFLTENFDNDKFISCSPFRNLSHLKAKSSVCFKDIIQTFTFSMQGKEPMPLETLIKENEEFLDIINVDRLLDMVEGPWKIGEEMEGLPEPYIDRHLVKPLVDIKYLNMALDDVSVVIDCINQDDILKNKLLKYNFINIDEPQNDSPGRDTGFICYTTRKSFSKAQFKELCTKDPNITKCHQFRIKSEEDLEWIRSNEDLDDLKDFMTDKNWLTSEKELWSLESANEINLITSDPGMGKSELMKNLYNNFPSNCWPVIIYPKEINSFFHRNNNIHCFEQFIQDTKFSKLDQPSLNILKILLSQKQVVYIWDALDEIESCNLDKVVDIILSFREKCLAQWVTSRCHLKNFLEAKLCVFSLSINQFSDEEQSFYIRKRLKDVCKEAEIMEINSKIRDSFALVEHKGILGIPLQIFMLTQLFRQESAKYIKLLQKPFVLTDLYNYFLEEKFNIFFKEKAEADLSNHQLKEMVDTQKAKTLENHVQLALRLLFSEESLGHLNINFREKLSDDKVVKFGIATTAEKSIRFIHMSFAEYLVATYISKLSDRKCLTSISKIIFNQRFNNVRFFLDLLLAKDSEIHINVLYKKYNKLTEYQSRILKSTDAGGRNALHLLCSWGQRHPRLKVRLEDNCYLFDAKTNFTVKSESEEYFSAVEYLVEACDISEADLLFKMTPLTYARKSESLIGEIKIMDRIRIKPNDYVTGTNILYYSSRFGYEDAFRLFSTTYCEEECFNRSATNGKVESMQFNARNEQNNTLLYVACYYGYLKVAEFLVANGADINFDKEGGYTLVFIASENGHEKIVEFLVSIGAKIDHADNRDESPLFVASKNGHENVVKILVSSGAKLNCTESSGDWTDWTPLCIASYNGHEKIAEYLVSSGAAVYFTNKRGWTPLHRASRRGHVKIAEFLISSGAAINCQDKSGNTPLHRASRYGQDLTVELLVSSGAKINATDNRGRTPLHRASRHGHEKIAKFLVLSGAAINRVDNSGRTPLHRASVHGHNKIVEFLQSSGAADNPASNDDWAQFFAASENGHEQIVVDLVSSGAEINRCDTFDRTSLYVASENGHDKIVEFLVSSGGEINRVDGGGNTPLLVASKNGHEKIVRFLASSGAEINLANNFGRTPLYIASKRGHYKIVQLLVSCGAEVNRSGRFGATPLSIASENGYDKIVEFLISSGAKMNP